MDYATKLKNYTDSQCETIGQLGETPPKEFAIDDRVQRLRNLTVLAQDTSRLLDEIQYRIFGVSTGCAGAPDADRPINGKLSELDDAFRDMEGTLFKMKETTDELNKL